MTDQRVDRTSGAARAVGQESGAELARRGWAAPLAAVVTVWLLLESVTGLWIWLAPFSVASQVQVLVHTVIGLALLGPYLYYQARHWWVWKGQRATAAMVLGYALMVAVLTSTVTGIGLTWQAAMGPRIAAAWDLVHLVSGIASSGLLVVHLWCAWLRRRSAQRDGDLTAALRTFARRLALGTVATTVVVGLATWLLPEEPRERPVPVGYALPTYAQQFDEYRGNPFAPSYARTAGLDLVPESLLAGSKSCGTAGCHGEILAEWEPSAHRFAAANPPFQKVQSDFAADRGAAETRYCAGCHDPISLFAGAKDIHNLELAAPGMQEGISCVVCHVISHVDQRGNADYVLTPPRKYLFESGDGMGKAVSDFLVRAYPRQHLADYDRNVLRTAEYCGACHKQFIPEALNRFGFAEGQNQYDEWRKSHWNADDPDLNLSCRDCHMRLVADSQDPGRGEAGDRRRAPDDGAHRHHGFIAANVFIPTLMKLPHHERHVAATEEWLRGETVLPEIADVYPEGPVAGLELVVPDTASPGEEIQVRVILTNRKAGHNYTTGPLDFLRSWVHLTVRDGAGAVVAEWGAIDPVTRRITDETGVDEDGSPGRARTMVLEATPLDDRGVELREHQLWRKAGGRGKRVVFPGHSDSQVFRIRVAEDAVGPLAIRADLNYRRYRQEFLDLALPDLERETGVYQPTVTQSSGTATVPLEGRR